MEDRHILKSYNKNLLLYHFVCPAKYRGKIFTDEVELTLRNICEEIGCDKDHVHFLLQSVLTYSPTKIITTVKNITSRRSVRLIHRKTTICPRNRICNALIFNMLKIICILATQLRY